MTSRLAFKSPYFLSAMYSFELCCSVLHVQEERINWAWSVWSEWSENGTGCQRRISRSQLCHQLLVRHRINHIVFLIDCFPNQNVNSMKAVTGSDSFT